MKEKILIIDDDEHILKTCERLLRSKDYHCFVFSSARKALENAELIQPAVVVADQRMPEIEGTVLLEMIRRTMPFTIRIIMTGYADLNAIISNINNGNIFKFIKKPWDDLSFLNEIEKAIEQYRMNDSLSEILVDDEKKKTDQNTKSYPVLFATFQ